jgi:hypothetical protein
MPPLQPIPTLENDSAALVPSPVFSQSTSFSQSESPHKLLQHITTQYGQVEDMHHAPPHYEPDENDDSILPPEPFIFDPGNGPRVRDTRTFLGSFFAQPPALDDPMCAELAQVEVLEMLMTILPEEIAMVWTLPFP